MDITENHSYSKIDMGKPDEAMPEVKVNQAQLVSFSSDFQANDS